VKEAHIHAYCAICKGPIRDGDEVVSIERKLEQIDSDDGMFTVKDSALLASLCASCGTNYPAGRIRVVFEGS
jgi:hypothetical protein